VSVLATDNPVVNTAPPITALSQLPSLYQRYMAEGICFFRKIPLSVFGSSTRFFNSWKSDPLAWVSRGYHIAQENGHWCVYQHLTQDHRLTLNGLERRERLLVPKQPELELAPTTAPLEPLPESLEKHLWEYQVTPARQLFRAIKHGDAEWGYPGALDLSDMGTGKTAQALAAAAATGRQIGVLCPVVGKMGWEWMANHFGVQLHFLETYEAVRGNWRSEIVSRRGDGQFWWKYPERFILILDEAQAVRHDSTLNFEVCSAAIRQRIPIIIASATVATSPLEFHFAGRIVGLHKGEDDWRRFLYQHGCIELNRKWKWDKDRRHLARIHGRLFPHRGCRVRKEDLGDACPETDIVVVPIDLPEAGEIHTQWEQTMRIFAQLKAAGKDTTWREHQARMAVWKRSETLLVPYIARMMKNDLAAGRSVVAFLHFDDTRKRLGDLLGTHDGFFGGQTPAIRRRLEADFQANRIRVLVSNCGAGGASISLHDKTGDYPRSAYIFPGDQVVKLTQATGRVARVGSKSVSLQYIPCIKGTITERMVHSLRRKLLGISTLNDGKESSFV
jgi:hypothetical protein